MRFIRRIPIWLLLTLLLAVPAGAQVGKGKFPVQTRGTPGQQNSLKVDNSTTPQRTEIGCEKDQEGGATVNGLQIVGSATTVNPSVSAVACAAGGDANIGITLTPLGTGTTVFGGVVTTYVVFFPAVQYCSTDVAPSTVANMIPTRLASNDWALARTAAGAETFNIRCVIPLLWRTTASKGSRLDSFSISQFISVVALTSNTFNNLSTTTYAATTANVVAAYGGAITITMPTATQATPYLTAGTVGTPAFMNTANVQVGIDFTAVLANTGVYRLYGIAATYSTALY